MLLVSGITGHTGSYFLKELMKNNYEENIRCIVRESSDTSLIDNSGLKIEKVIGTLENKEFLATVMKDVDTMVHIYNIHHSLEVVKTALNSNSNIKRLILVHTTGVYSKFKTASEDYQRIEKEISKLLSNTTSNISVTILRPTMIYGDLRDKNISKFIRMVDKLPVIPIINNGENLIQPVNAADLGSAYYSVLLNSTKVNGKTYNLSGGKPIKMKDFLNLISKELNKKAIFINIPLDVGVLLAKTLYLFSFKKFDYIEKVQRMGENRSFPHQEAIKDFGYNPICLEKGIKNEVERYLEAKTK